MSDYKLRDGVLSGLSPRAAELLLQMRLADNPKGVLDAAIKDAGSGENASSLLSELQSFRMQARSIVIDDTLEMQPRVAVADVLQPLVVALAGDESPTQRFATQTRPSPKHPQVQLHEGATIAEFEQLDSEIGSRARVLLPFMAREGRDAGVEAVRTILRNAGRLIDEVGMEARLVENDTFDVPLVLRIREELPAIPAGHTVSLPESGRYLEIIDNEMTNIVVDLSALEQGRLSAVGHFVDLDAEPGPYTVSELQTDENGQVLGDRPKWLVRWMAEASQYLGDAIGDWAKKHTR